MEGISYITLFLFGLLLFSIAIDRRRFRNGIYFLIFLSFLLLWILLNTVTNFEKGFAIVVMFTYMFVILLMTTVLPVVLIINGLIMIRREGFSLSHILSLLFGLFIIFGEVAFVYYINTYSPSSTFLYIGSIWVTGIVMYVSFVFLSFMFYTILFSLLPRSTNYDYIVILGCGLLRGEIVTPLLKSRLNRAIKVSKRNKKNPVFICSGGQGPDEKISEAQAMKNYLLSQGINEDSIIIEDQSLNTMQNIQYSNNMIKLLDNHDDNILYVTNNFHTLRTAVYTKKLKVKGDVVGSRTRLYYWPSAMIREFIALMKHYFIAFIIFVILWTIFVAAGFM